MTDLISREAAIEEFHNKLCCEENGREYAIGFSGIRETIEALPSAQPEIIRCKDCKHHRKDSHGLYYCCRKEYGYGWGLNDFCSWAERREE